MWARPALDYSSHRHYSEPVCRGVTFLMNPGEEGNIIAQKAGESGCGCRALCTQFQFHRMTESWRWVSFMTRKQ